MISKKELAKKIDHTMLGPEVTLEKIKDGVAFALENYTASVCVSPDRLATVVNLLAGSDVLACTVIGFPHGTQTTAVKVEEAKEAVATGAQELDMVINVGYLKDGKFQTVQDEIAQVVEAAGKTPVKVIIETTLLTDEEKIKACQLAEEAGASFLKTSTGYASGGATAEDVSLMRQNLSDHVQVKASGGIRSLDDCLAMLEAGADRIGASRTADILAGLEA